jgi:flagellin
MAIIINNNVPSLTAQRYLGNANDALAKSIERLSSGLRINHASDDASGLAISEKLRAQISGLQRASMNAQDGISMLQTAEGGLQNIQDMIQRIRELSVQASSDTFTSSDRQEIQKEIEQLIDEIDRTSTSTEFNTKKLLNGDASALWSSNSNKIDTIINGPIKEGSYNINVNVDPGKNYVYTTDVMTLNDDAIGAEIDTAIGTTPDANDTNVAYVSNPVSLNATGTAYYTVTIGDTTGGDSDSATINGTYQQSGSAWTVALGSTIAADNSGYIEIEFLQNYTGAATTDGFRYRFINAKTGAVGSWTNGDLNTNGIANTELGGIVSANITVSSGDQVTSGDKILLAISNVDDVSAGVAASGGGTIQIKDGPAGYSGPIIEYDVDTLTKVDDGDTEIDYNDITVYIAELDQTNGNLDFGNITLGFQEQADNGAGNNYAATDTGDFRMTVKGGGDVATSTTKLKDIALFTNADGVNIFDNTQELTIYGNGKSTTIYLEGDDTISDFETKLTNAIVDDLSLGATTNISSTVSNVNNNLVNFVSSAEAQAGTNESVAGTFVIQTAIPGEDGQIAFVGNEDLINGLSVSMIQEGENSTMTVNVTDAVTGNKIGSDVVNDNVLHKVIQGVDVKIASDVGIDVSWDATNREIVFESNNESENFKLHLANNQTQLQIGANEGQFIDTSIPQMDSKSLGLDKILVVDQDLAEKSITLADNALNKVSGVRATIGAQINRLDYSITGLDVARENITAAESRIRDLDVASEMAEFTKQQILAQSATAMLAQANQLPQMALKLLGY